MSGEVEFGLEFGQYVCYVLCWKKKLYLRGHVYFVLCKREIGERYGLREQYGSHISSRVQWRFV